ncbi:Amine GPCR [Paragonimus heterotremus]|uniref:Amine GPCR n=1 Tax=Paragonimus heterotremus TaxID=100268 RepID=A0A8J4WJQ5_9TREM|nr:Amine GPCR [Paragonimus heterotremus]
MINPQAVFIPNITQANILPQSENHDIIKLITTCILAVIATVGLIGNGLVVWAFRCQVTQGIVSSLLILLLACLDFTSCAVGIPATIYLDIWSGQTVDWLCRLHMAFKGFIVPVSAFLLVLIALERFLLICFIPGIGLKRNHLRYAFLLILTVGILLAIPMGLHVQAVEVGHERDVLLELLLGAHQMPSSSEWFAHPTVRMRCDKDDNFINDTIYWHYQVIVMVLFVTLLLSLAAFYGTIFLFVWRHESLMFERYGKSKYRGYWIRIHASSSSSVRNTSGKSTKTAKSVKEQQACSESGDKRMSSTKNSPISSDGKPERLRCACLCESSRGEEDSVPSATSNSQCHMKVTESTELRNPEILSVLHSNSMADEQSKTSAGNKYQYCCLRSSASARQTMGLKLDLINNRKVEEVDTNIPFPKHADYKTRTKWAAKTMERRRNPHVHTARTFALIAVAFVISYSPYLVYTSMPMTKRNMHSLDEDDPWYVQVGRVLFYLYFTNSAANPVIYSCMNRHFRSRVSTLFYKCNCRTNTCQTMTRPNAADPKVDREMQTLTRPADSTFEQTVPKLTQPVLGSSVQENESATDTAVVDKLAN